MHIRKLIEDSDRETALHLVLRVFMEYEAPDYIEEGIDTFKNFLSDKEQTDKLEMYGAFEGDIIVGVIASRNNATHISLFFVDGSHHRKGIGKLLFETLLNHTESEQITVNSSPFAVDIYKRLGFVSTNDEQTTNGIRFTPMVYKRELIVVREIISNDINELLLLYTQLHGNKMPEKSKELLLLWEQIICDPRHHIIVAEENGKLVSSCVLIIVPNLTHHQRPYALVENVITDEEFRNRGFATACLNYAKEIALTENCYKIMLLTGSKEDATLRFYEKAGYNRNDKTAFIQWLNL